MSAFLKLRGDGPAFLLESAEQGRLGRWSFLGFRPAVDPPLVGRAALRVGRRLRAESGAGARRIGRPTRRTRMRAVAEYLGRYEIAEPERAAAVRRRRGRLLRLRPRANGRAARRAEPRPGRPARHGPDDHRRARRIRPSAPRGDADRECLRARTAGSRTPMRRAAETIGEVRERLREPVPAAEASVRGRAASSSSRT